MDLCIYGLVLLPQIRSEKQPQRSVITCDTIIGVPNKLLLENDSI